ncbi:LLM class flavin-dependent oxidoreductase [Amnibacterium sp. CER49]|uniref:LLM class flavin-dependent oxidoreductase n=1 Tax=Amnibacterium sp. CER49 TaxID=3039161 RepID=UPI002448036B|nr:LLM class flavin-dependent oxidoreductase [Amnibacterium sp. CER49]MDH2442484.1 LLM class flavin-dependent oxidoreductase [Amnibacterium sp. CER49]
MHGDVSLGVPGALGPEAIGALAPHVEQCGFTGIWVNDTPGGDSLAGLAAAGAAAPGLRLAAGVIPLDRRPADDVLAAVRATRVPEDRLTIGIGSGAGRAGALARVREAVAALRAGTTARVAVGALGPRMRALAAETADAVLLNWVTPEHAATQAAELRAVAPGLRVVAYARTVVEDDAREALETEARRYAAVPAYAANFARQGVGPLDTVLPRDDADLAAGVAAYLEGVDEVVLRAITRSGGLDELIGFAETAGAALGLPRR